MPPANSDRLTFIFIIVLAFAGLIGTFLVFQKYYIYEPQPPEVITMLQGKDQLMSFPVIRKDSAYFNIQPAPRGNIDTTGMTHVKHVMLNRNPSFLLWSTFFNVMMAVALGISPWATQQFFRLKKMFSISWGSVALAGLIVLIFMGVLVWMTTQSAGYYYPETIIKDLRILFTESSIPNLLVAIAMFFMIPQVVTMVLVGFTTSRYTYDKTKESLATAVSRYLELERFLRGAIISSGIILVFAVLTASTLRRSIHAVVAIDGFDLFPPEAVYTYGFLQSFFMAMLYVPSYISLRRMGHALRQDLVDTGQDDSHINLPTVTMETFELLFGVLAPFIGSFIPDLF